MGTTERTSFVLADNAGLMTLDGTNTWILREPGAVRSVVVDPGPDDEQHLGEVLAVAGEVALVLYTHWHADHTDAIDRMVELTGAPARAVDAAWCRDAEPLTDGETIDVDGLRIEVVTTPGHTADSVCFLLPDDASLLTGDTILGRGTTVIAPPDGHLGSYLDSMAKVQTITDERGVVRLLPAHGPVLDDATAAIAYYLAHRHERLDQVRRAVAAGATTPREIVELVYADVDESLWGAAELSVAAQLDHLRGEG